MIEMGLAIVGGVALALVAVIVVIGAVCSVRGYRHHGTWWWDELSDTAEGSPR